MDTVNRQLAGLTREGAAARAANAAKTKARNYRESTWDAEAAAKYGPRLTITRAAEGVCQEQSAQMKKARRQIRRRGKYRR